MSYAYVFRYPSSFFSGMISLPNSKTSFVRICYDLNRCYILKNISLKNLWEFLTWNPVMLFIYLFTSISIANILQCRTIRFAIHTIRTKTFHDTFRPTEFIFCACTITVWRTKTRRILARYLRQKTAFNDENPNVETEFSICIV